LSTAHDNHDHRLCVRHALSTAEQICRKGGARLTPQRRQVLELVWSSHAPIGAYDIIGRMTREQGETVAPPTVYRALEFLLAHGLIHRIESLNAYIGCPCPHTRHAGHFLICRNCHAAEEVQDGDLTAALETCARRRGFASERETVELRGLCAACTSAGVPQDVA
jgi:Fur family zinc uptake transcriptional regulator